MIDAFRTGGDFHSRTALGMYKEVADAVNSGAVLLEVKLSILCRQDAALGELSLRYSFIHVVLRHF
jgi:hypothetical protein